MLRRTLLMLALAACSEAHEGRSSTRPDDGAEASDGRDTAAAGEQSSATTTGDRAPDDDSASDSSSSDVNWDASLGTTPESADAPGDDDASCPGQGVDVRGESQFGPLQASEVSVSYWGGFTMGTTLLVRGTAGGRAIEIHARVYTIKYDDLAAPVGEYRSAEDASRSSDMSVFARFCDDPWTHCGGTSTDLRHAVLRIDKHEVPQVVKVNSPVRFEGTLRISDPGWSLDLPFALRRACGTSVDL